MPHAAHVSTTTIIINTPGTATLYTDLNAHYRCALVIAIHRTNVAAMSTAGCIHIVDVL